MQTKSSYRVLKWTFFVGAFATLGSACVVTSGDGGDDPFGDAGESGSATTAGKNSAAGTGGSATAGTSTGGKGGTATTPAAGAGGEGGEVATYVPGLCEADSPTPSIEPSCAPVAKDDAEDRKCVKCLKASCCTEWQACFGDAPTTACGYGATEADAGQFVCAVDCFAAGAATADNADDLLAECTAGCANQCDTVDNGLPLDATSSLIECANSAACQDVCFPFN